MKKPFQITQQKTLQPQTNPYEKYQKASTATIKPQSSLFQEKNLNKMSSIENIKHEPVNATTSKHQKLSSFKSEARNEMKNLGLLDESDLADLNTDDDDEFLAMVESSKNSKLFPKGNSSKISTTNDVMNLNSNKNNAHDTFSSSRNFQPIKRQSSHSENLNKNLENLNKKPKSCHLINESVKVNNGSVKDKNPKMFQAEDEDDDDDSFLLDVLKIEKSNQISNLKIEPSAKVVTSKPLINQEYNKNQLERRELLEQQSQQEPKEDLLELKIDRLINLLKKEKNCCINSKSACTHIIKGYIKTLTAPLNKINMKWYQKCLISDGTEHLNCYIDDAITTDLMQFTCKQAKELFQKSRETKDTKILQVYEGKILCCAQKLAHFSGLIHLKYDSVKSEYCIVKFESPDEKYFQFLKNKLKKNY